MARARKPTAGVLLASVLAGGGCDFFGLGSEAADAGAEADADAGEGGADGDSPPAGDAAPPPDGTTDPSDVPERVRDYIRADDYTRLVLEVDVVEDMEPRDGVESDIEELFADVLDKPDGVEAVRDDVIPPRDSDDAWTFSELQDLADDYFDLDVGGDTTVLHTMWVDGHSDQDDENSRILGLQFGRHNVLFKETIEDVCESSAPPLFREETCRRTERGIWIHEIGHAIGLVDNGLPMVEDHRDDDRGPHSENDDCIMYWAYTSGDLGDRVGDLVGGGEPELGFDEYCLNDIAALREAE